MASDYPGAIDNAATTHADIEDSVLAVQGELGTNPSGAAATVAARLAALDTTVSGKATPADITSASTADRARANHTGAQSLDTTTDSATRLAMTSAERTKLTGVATGATANASDAQLRDRATHTGTQAAGTITGLATVATSGAASDLTGTLAAARIADSSLPVAKLSTTGTKDTTTYLRGDGTFAVPPTSGGTSSTYPDGSTATVVPRQTVYDPRDYGAVTGSTPTVHTASIQAAINAASAAGGGIVQLPGGGDGAKLTVTQLGIREGVTLRGRGNNATWIMGTDAALDVIVVDETAGNVAGFVVEELLIEGGRDALHFTHTDNTNFLSFARGVVRNVIAAASGRHGFFLDAGCLEYRLENCHAKGAASHGFYTLSTDHFLLHCTSQANGANGFQVDGANNHLTSCKAFGNDSGFVLNSRHTLVGCEAQENREGGFLSNGLDVVFAGCMADSNGGTGFHLQEANRQTLSGCHSTSTPGLAHTHAAGFRVTEAANGYGAVLVGCSSSDTVPLDPASSYTSASVVDVNGSAFAAAGGGAAAPNVVTRTTAYTASDGDYVIASGTFTVTLPAATTGRRVTVINSGTGTITVEGAGLVNGDENATLVSKGAGGEFTADGTNWWVPLAGGGGGLDLEAVQDAVAAMIVAGTNMTKSYDDEAGTLTLTSAAAAGGFTDAFPEADGAAPNASKWSIAKTGTDSAQSTVTVSGGSMNILAKGPNNTVSVEAVGVSLAELVLECDVAILAGNSGDTFIDWQASGAQTGGFLESANAYAIKLGGAGTTTFTILKWQGGDFLGAVDGADGVTFNGYDSTAGAVNHLRLTTSASTISVQANGGTVHTFTDSAVTTAGSVRFRKFNGANYTGSTMTVDNVVITSS